MLVDEEYEKVKMMIRTLSQVVLYNANLTNLNNVTGDQVITAAVIYNFKISDAHFLFDENQIFRLGPTLVTPSPAAMLTGTVLTTC